MRLIDVVLPRRFEWVLFRAERLSPPEPGGLQIEEVGPGQRLSTEQHRFLRQHMRALSLWYLLRWHRRGEGWVFFARQAGRHVHYAFVRSARRYRRQFPVIREPAALLIGPVRTETWARGRGVLRRVLAHAVAELAQRGLGPFYANIRPDNEPSIRGFERAGFTRIGVWTGARAMGGLWLRSRGIDD